jgi:hypothetical protein
MFAIIETFIETFLLKGLKFRPSFMLQFVTRPSFVFHSIFNIQKINHLHFIFYFLFKNAKVTTNFTTKSLQIDVALT